MNDCRSGPFIVADTGRTCSNPWFGSYSPEPGTLEGRTWAECAGTDDLNDERTTDADWRDAPAPLSAPMA